jgi:putative tryptophan/tyrosine transport system substrate-binding protein
VAALFVAADATGIQRMTTRRRLLSGLGVGALAFSTSLFAQQALKIARVGWLVTGRKPPQRAALYLAFLEAMREAGYVEGTNLLMEERYADEAYDRLPALAAELVKENVQVIVGLTGPAVQAAQKATSTVPIVMAATSDPVGRKIIASLARPGSNVTGPASMGFDLVDKHLELLHVALPKATRIGVLVNPANADAPRVLNLLDSAASKLNIGIVPARATSPADIDAAFRVLVRERAEALIIAPDSVFSAAAARINALALTNRLPTIYWIHPPVIAGAFMGYGPDLIVEYRRVASYVDRILKGARPAEMPSEQPNKLDLLINLKTAKALGIQIPHELLVRADRLVE